MTKDLVDAAHADSTPARELGQWNESRYVTILNHIRKRKKLSWPEYDTYQKQFWHLLNILKLCDVLESNPLDSWIFNDRAKTHYKM